MARNCAMARSEFGLRLGDIHLVAALAHRILGALLGGQRRGLVQIARPRRRIGQHGHEMRLDFQGAAADVERLFLVALATARALRPAFSVVSNGAWRGAMPSSPCEPGTNTMLASPEKICPSALTMST